MMKAAFRTALTILLSLSAHSGLLLAQGLSFPDAVLSRTNRTLLQQGSSLTLVTNELSWINGIKVLTNGSYCVNKGRPFSLEEGQQLRSDGFLLSPDGSIRPVFDHIVMRGTQVLVYKDGEATPLEKPLILPDRSIINPDGWYERNIRRARLVDGQLISPDGVAINRFDTITYNDGRVVVYKSGAIIPLQNREVIMGMYDGSKIRGDGQITWSDGSLSQMTNGQLIVVQGVRASW